MEQINDLLMKHPFFDGLEPRFIEFISGCAKNSVFKKDEYIFKEGGEANQFFMIRHGSVALEISSPQTGNITIQTLNEGETLGWSWLFAPYRWQFHARCMDDVRAIELNGQCIRKKCEEDHDLGFELMKRFAHIIEQRLQSTRLQLLDVYSPTRKLSPLRNKSQSVIR